MNIAFNPVKGDREPLLVLSYLTLIFLKLSEARLLLRLSVSLLIASL
jgi:hypothetical protein